MSEIRSIQTLKEWEHNQYLRAIKQEGEEELAENLRMGQHTTLLIRPDGTVLGGNNRLRVMRTLGYTEVECTVLDFGQDEEGYYAIINGNTFKDSEGKPVVHFSSIEEGEFQFAASHNVSPAFWQKDNVISFIGNFPNINPKKFSMQFEPHENVGGIIEKIQELPTAKEPKLVECPACGHRF